MKLLPIFLPIYDQDGNTFAAGLYKDLSKVFSKKFGGVTVYKRAPADGFWEHDHQPTEKDQLVIFEVMVEDMDYSFWKSTKLLLQDVFQQKEILIRIIPVTTI